MLGDYVRRFWREATDGRMARFRACVFLAGFVGSISAALFGYEIRVSDPAAWIVAGFLLVFGGGFLAAPYRIYRKDQARLAELQGALQPRLEVAGTESQILRERLTDHFGHRVGFLIRNIGHGRLDHCACKLIAIADGNGKPKFSGPPAVVRAIENSGAGGDGSFSLNAGEETLVPVASLVESKDNSFIQFELGGQAPALHLDRQRWLLRYEIYGGPQSIACELVLDVEDGELRLTKADAPPSRDPIGPAV
jgi:hypothetical protein